MIVWLASYPRSGNTYFRVLLKQCFGISTYSAYDDTPLAEKPQVRDMVGHTARINSIQAMSGQDEVFFVKTHDLPSDSSPAIYLVRDGRDALISYAHYIESFENHSDDLTQSDNLHFILHDLILYNASFGGWGPNVLAWTQRSHRTAIIKFEDLVSSPEPSFVVEKALSDVGYTINLSEAQNGAPSFKELHQQMPNFFREGKIGTWRNEFPADLHDLFWEKHGNAMQKLGYVK